jgi:solute carrier family 25 (adenine nucleotide translocator) protein 4/5/6/31
MLLSSRLAFFLHRLVFAFTMATSLSQKPRLKRAIPQWREALAGAAAGAFSKTALAPVERIKLLSEYRLFLFHILYLCFVAQAHVLHLSPTFLKSISCLEQLQGSVSFASNQSAWQVGLSVYRQEGLLAFWRGNLPNVLRTAGTAAINFTCMDYYKKVAVAPFFDSVVVSRSSSRESTAAETARHQRRRQLLTSFVSGGFAGATSTTLLYPFEFLRTRLAMDVGAGSNRQYCHGMRQVVTTIFRSDGVRGFFQGYGIALSGGIIYRILFLGGYDGLKDEVLYRNQSSNRMSTSTLSWKERMAIAQTISLSAGTICYPFDSVRRRMMMQAGNALSNRRYRNSMHCVAAVLKQEGVRGFYLGIGPNLVRSVSGALLLVGYDVVKTLLR